MNKENYYSIEAKNGDTIDSIMDKFRHWEEHMEGIHAKCDFNGKTIYSDETADQAYLKITGMTEAEFKKEYPPEQPLKDLLNIVAANVTSYVQAKGWTIAKSGTVMSN